MPPNFSLPDVVNLILKLMTLLLLVLYAIFAGVMVRQEQLMDKVIDESFESVVRMLVVLHLLFALGLLIFAFLVL